MEKFLAFQKPLLRLDLYVELILPATSELLGDAAILLLISGLHDLPKTEFLLVVNQFGHPHSRTALVSATHLWSEDTPSKVLSLPSSESQSLTLMASYNELSLTNLGQRVTLADLTILSFEAFCTDGVRDKIKQISVDANGFQLCSSLADGNGDVPSLKWGENLPYNVAEHKWVRLVKRKEVNFLFNPPEQSRQFLPLLRIEEPK